MLRFFALLLFPLGAVAAVPGYVGRMIECSEADEHFVSQAYDAFVALAGTREVKAGELHFPARWAIARPDYIIIWRAFYISPNELRGFELAIPRNCMVEKDGILGLALPVVVEKEGTRAGIRTLVLRKKNASEGQSSKAQGSSPSAKRTNIE
jgi:hypothetical protein